MRKKTIRRLVAVADRAQQAGMLMAASEVPRTLQQSLLPRSLLDQAMVTGLSTSLVYTIGSLLQDNVEDAAYYLSGAEDLTDDERMRPERRYAIFLDLCMLASGALLQLCLPQRPSERIERAHARAFGYWASATATSGLAIALFEEGMDLLGFRWALRFQWAVPTGSLLSSMLNERRNYLEAKAASEKERRVRPEIAVAMIIGFGMSVRGMAIAERMVAKRLSGLFSRLFPNLEWAWGRLSHLTILTLLGSTHYALIQLAWRSIDQEQEKLEPSFSTPPSSPMISGGAGSLVHWGSLTKHGRRLTSAYLDRADIARVMGEEALQPIRVYVGVNSADSQDERVELAMKEMERTGAFNRSLIVVTSPTGTGFVNYTAVEAMEYLSRGDIAILAPQYSKRPSVLSLGQVPGAILLNRAILEAISHRIAGFPSEKRPRLVVFGESLGAWAIQDAFLNEGTSGMVRLGVDRALWIGTPYGAKWQRQVFGPPRPEVDPTIIRRFNDFEQVEALDPSERSKLRYYMLTHNNDGVSLFTLALLVRKPDWLGDPATRPKEIPSSMKYSIPTTFFQTGVDLKNSGFMNPVEFRAVAHDYRTDLARFISEAYRLTVSPEQLAKVELALRENERVRAEALDAVNEETNQRP